MPNVTTNAKNRKQSRFLGERRKSFFTKRTCKTGFNFLRINRGSLSVIRMPFGSYRATFSSIHTGRYAFAYGEDFGKAYQNLIRRFNLKYSV